MVMVTKYYKDVKMDSETKALIKQSKTYQLGDRAIEIKPLVIEQYLKVFDKIVEIYSKVLTEAPNVDLEKVQPQDFLILKPVLPEVLALLNSILELPETFLETHASLCDITELIKLELEVNQIEVIRKNFQLVKVAWKGQQRT